MMLTFSWTRRRMCIRLFLHLLVGVCVCTELPSYKVQVMIILLYFTIKMDDQVLILFVISIIFPSEHFSWVFSDFGLFKFGSAVLLGASRVAIDGKKEKKERKKSISKSNLWQNVTFRFIRFFFFSVLFCFVLFGLTESRMRHSLYYMVHLRHTLELGIQSKAVVQCVSKEGKKALPAKIHSSRDLDTLIVFFFSFLFSLLLQQPHLHIEWRPNSHRMNWIFYRKKKKLIQN